MNLIAAWVGILLGFISGSISGLFFYREDWMGGYASWRRRMVRLGHISFFGLGFVNLAFALTARLLPGDHAFVRTSWLLLVGAATMPLVCYLSAYRKPLRHLFFIPVGSLVLGVVFFLFEGFVL